MDYRSFFEIYTTKYKTKYPNEAKAFELKEEHSLKVANESKKITSYLNLSDYDKKIAEFVGLFHDIGRFKQFAYYKTFNDAISDDHGKLSVKELIKENIIYQIPKNYRSIVIAAIFFHNKKILPKWGLYPQNKKQEKKALFLKIIRDADKLDILRVLTNHYTNTKNDNSFISMNFPDIPIVSQKIIGEIQNNKPASMENVKTITDLKLFQLSWIFDLNFTYTAIEFKKRGYFQQIINTIPKNKFTEIPITHIEKHLSNIELKA